MFAISKYPPLLSLLLGLIIYLHKKKKKEKKSLGYECKLKQINKLCILEGLKWGVQRVMCNKNIRIINNNNNNKKSKIYCLSSQSNKIEIEFLFKIVYLIRSGRPQLRLFIVLNRHGFRERPMRT